MDKNHKRVSELFRKYLSRTASADETQEFLDYVDDPLYTTEIHELLSGAFEDQADVTGLSEEGRNRVLNRIFKQKELKANKSKVFPLWSRIAAAASIILCLGIGSYFIIRHKQPSANFAYNRLHDIAPGGNKAILTLSNGQKIILDGKQGTIANEAGKAVKVNADGKLEYTGGATPGTTVYNTLYVPTGNHRDLVLPDGSEVSLDAGSSITYPVAFTVERKVSMTGQAYFAVKHDPAHPFYTTVRGVTIQDIGTEFNINAYDDEPSVKSTLIQGSVKVNGQLLQPGEQAQTKDNHTIINTADIDAVTAWRKNDFYFSNESLKNSMRQIARWYNVNVVYDKVDDNLKLFVDVTRSTNLSVVLQAIENTGKVKCRLEGNTITITQVN